MKPQAFAFQQFTLSHHRSAHKIGTDGILLGTWVKVSKPKAILDFGSGCGLISFIAAQRFPEAPVFGLEIDEASFRESQENLLNNPTFKNIEFQHADLMDFRTSKKFDLILTNPPYFEGDLKAPDKRRAQARQTETGELDKQIFKLRTLLDEQGEIALILPLDIWQAKLEPLASMGLFPKEICYVRHQAKKAVKRVLVKFSLQRTNIHEEELHLFNDDGLKRNSDFQNLVDNFLLRQK